MTRLCVSRLLDGKPIAGRIIASEKRKMDLRPATLKGHFCRRSARRLFVLPFFLSLPEKRLFNKAIRPSMEETLEKYTSIASSNVQVRVV